jgi:hypothetical protein
MRINPPNIWRINSIDISGDFIVRTSKTIVMVAFIIASLGDVRGRPSDVNDISAYYGFGEMEIVKLGE